MKVNFNSADGRKQSFKMNIVQEAGLTKYINSLHITQQQNNLKQALDICQKRHL